MLYIITLVLVAVECTFTSFPMICGENIEGGEFREIKYIDLLCEEQRELKDNVLTTIFGYIPSYNDVISIEVDSHNVKCVDSNSSIGGNLLRVAFEKLGLKNPELDELVLETLISFFFKFLKESSSANKFVKPEFYLSEEETLKIPVKQVINYLIEHRGERNIFKVFLDLVGKKLNERVSSFSFDLIPKRMNISFAYAIYMKLVVNILLEKISAKRRFFGDNEANQFEKYFVLVPRSSIETNGIVSQIFDVTNFVDSSKIEQ